MKIGCLGIFKRKKWGCVMVSSVNNANAVDMNQMLYDFSNNVANDSFDGILISDVPGKSSNLKLLGEDTLRSFANLQLHFLLSNSNNESPNPESLSFIDSILEKASGEDLEKYFTSSKKDGLSILNATKELIKNVGLEKAPQYNNFMSEITKNAIYRLTDRMNFESDLEKLQEQNKELESLFDMAKKYNENYKRNLALRYEV